MASLGGLVLSRDSRKHLALASLGGLVLSRDSRKHLVLASLRSLLMGRQNLVLGSQPAIDSVQLRGNCAQFGSQKILQGLPDVLDNAHGFIVSRYNCGLSAKLFI